MALLSIREKFRELSGRYDLVGAGPGFADNGAEWYINQGQKLLDRLEGFPRQWSSEFQEIAAGVWYVQFDNLRAIKHVYVNTSEARSKLDQRTMEELKEFYPDPIADIDQGTPLYYTQARLRTEDITDMNDQGTYMNFKLLTEDGTSSGIVIMPPPDETYVVEIEGFFYSPELSDDTDVSFWTEQHPDALVFAALYKLEVSYRNMTGARDWMAAIKQEVSTVDMDMVEYDLAEVSSMKG